MVMAAQWQYQLYGRSLLLKMVDHISDHAPDLERVTGGIDLCGGELPVLRQQTYFVESAFQPADQHLSIQYSNHNFPALRFEASVHDHHIPVMDPCTGHGFASHTQKEGGGLVLNELLIQVDPPLHIIIRRCTEARGIGCLHIPLIEVFGTFVRGIIKNIVLHIIKFGCAKLFSKFMLNK